MNLSLRRSYDDSDEFWSVDCEGTNVGSIVHDTHRPEPVWKWSNTVQAPSPGIAKNGMAETREDAMREFRASWDRYREWLGDERWQQWVDHMALVRARSQQWERQKAGEEPGGY